MGWPLIGRRRHEATVRVVAVLVDTHRPLSGYEVARTVDLSAGVVQAALAELEAHGAVVSQTSDERRGRRWYRLADRNPL